jgi:hypothetical protein
MSMRILVIALLALCGCATASDRAPAWQGASTDDPAPTSQTQLSQRDECAASCQAKYDRCSDDSAKERSEPHTNCYQDLRDCNERCDAAVAADPATRVNQGATVSDGASVQIGNAVISGTVSTVSKERR